MYRGVTRFLIQVFCTNNLMPSVWNLVEKVLSFLMLSLISSISADTTSMEDGKLGSVELPETRTFILGHLVSHSNLRPLFIFNPSRFHW